MVFFLTEAPLNTNIKVKQMVISQVRNDNQGGEHQKDVDMLLKLRMIMIICVCVCGVAVVVKKTQAWMKHESCFKGKRTWLSSFSARIKNVKRYQKNYDNKPA